MYDLNQEFKKRYDPLLEEAEELRTQLDILTSDSSFKLEVRQLEAKVKVIGDEVTRLTSEGIFDEAEKKEQEKREIAGHLRNLTSGRNQEIDGLKNRISSLLGEKPNIASAVLREGWPLIQKEVWSRLEEAINLFDSAWEEIQNFQRSTGATTVGVQSGSLKIYPNQQRELWQKLVRWVHIPERD